MTEKTRHYVIIGGIAVTGIVILVSLAGEKSSAPANVTTPAAPGPSSAPVTLNIPTYPAASFAPSPITIVESPTFNAPGQRPAYFPGPLPKSGDGDCGCKDGCSTAVPAPLSLDVIASTAAKLNTVRAQRRLSEHAPA